MPASGPVLVTGASGLVGGALVRELAAAGVPVVAFDVQPAPGVAAFNEGDVRDGDALVQVLRDARPRAVVHLAGIVGVGTDADPHTATLVNVVGTSNVLEAARREGVRRVVLASSIMRESGRGLPHTGGDFPAPRNLYGAHKLVAELEAEVYRQRFGLEPVAVAIAGTMGAARRRASPARSPHLYLVQKLARGEPAVLEADARWQLPLRSTGQVARLLAGAATAERCRAFYHAGGRPTTLQELADAAGRIEPSADVRIVGGTWATIPPVSSAHAEADFGLRDETPDQLVARAVAEQRVLDGRRTGG